MVDTLKERLVSKYTVEPNSCWYFTGYIDDIGYGIITYQRRAYKAHRVSWIVHRGEIPTGMQVLHRCDNRLCINPEHLFLGTHQENMKDRDCKGRGANVQGMNHPNVWLTETEVLEIRRLHETGEYKRVELADMFKTSPENIYRIVKRLTWRHI